MQEDPAENLHATFVVPTMPTQDAMELARSPLETTIAGHGIGERRFGRVEATCTRRHRTFPAWASTIEKGLGKFCSKACQHPVVAVACRNRGGEVRKSAPGTR